MSIGLFGSKFLHSALHGNTPEPKGPIYWRVSERGTPHLTYCERQATWRGPFPTLLDAEVNVRDQGYSTYHGEVEFFDGDLPVVSTPRADNGGAEHGA